jgi:flagellar biosynthetic protein FliQ
MSGFDSLLHEMMVLTALLCIPVLAVAAVVGTAVAVVQAATQIQEQTLTLLPKVAAVGATVALFGVFAMHGCESLFHHAIEAIPRLVSGQ